MTNSISSCSITLKFKVFLRKGKKNDYKNYRNWFLCTAEEALKRGTGARALRAILEEFMLDIMYEIPKDPNIGSVVVTRPYLEKKGGPLIQVREG